jgi:hypothetical protein
MMRTTILSLAGVATLMAMAGCNNAKSPDTAARDMAAADRHAAKEVREARREQQKDMSMDAYDVTVAQLDGDHKIAIQQCDTLQGRDQQACKDKADADYEAAKANAKATRVSRTP